MSEKVDIEKLIGQSVLASAPDLLFKIINSLDSELSSKQIGEIIGHDQSISAQVLKLSNSSFFGFKGQIKTLGMAINILGTKTVRNIAVTSLLFAHTNNVRLWNIDILNFWLKSFLVADITRELSHRLGLDGDEGYIAGLLHEIGKLILFAQKQDITDLFKEEHTAKDLQDYEIENWGINSSELGKRLLDKWNIPDAISDAISLHKKPREGNVLSKVIFIANEFAFIITDPKYRSSIKYPLYKKILENIDISEQDFAKFAAEIPDMAERGKLIMKIMTKKQVTPLRRRFVNNVTLVSPYEYSLSKCLLELIEFNVDVVTPDEIRANEEARLNIDKVDDAETSQVTIDIDVNKISDVKTEEKTVSKSGIFNRIKYSLFKSKKIENSNEEVEDEAEDEEPEYKPISWQPLVIFEDCDPVEIKRTDVVHYQVMKNPALVKDTPIPFFFCDLDINIK